MIKYFFVAFLIFITCMSCTDYLGQSPVRVSDESKTWLPFHENDTLMFVNISNDTLILTAKPVKRLFKFVTSNYNDMSGEGDSYNYEFLTYTCSNVDSTISLSTELGFASDYYMLDLFAYIQLKLKWNHSAAGLSIIIPDNNLSWPYDISFDSHKFLDTFNFEGNQYLNVHTTKNPGPYTLFYSKSYGIIGFVADNKTWRKIIQ